MSALHDLNVYAQVEIIPDSVEMDIAEALRKVARGEMAIQRSRPRVGDVEVFNPRVVHRGSPNETTVPRSVLAFTFQPTRHLTEHGAAGGGSSVPRISEQSARTLSEKARGMVRLLPRL
jgi:hypothetical protein